MTKALGLITLRKMRENFKKLDKNAAEVFYFDIFLDGKRKKNFFGGKI